MTNLTFMSLESQIEKTKNTGLKKSTQKNNNQKLLNFFLKDIKQEIQGAKKIPNIISQMISTPRNIMVKFLDTKNKEKILRAGSEKLTNHHWGKLNSK